MQSAELAEWFRAQAPRLNALLAEWAVKAAEFENCEGWRDAGIRSCAHWFVHECGLGRPFAKALLRAGHCAEELPAVRDAFERGDISLEKVRLLSTVATADNQQDWVDQALTASPPQLARQTREARSPYTDPEADRLHRSLRYLHLWNDEIGMLRISGALPKEDGWVVKEVIDRHADALRERRRHAVVVEPRSRRRHPRVAHRADALVEICHAAMGGAGNGPASGPGADARPRRPRCPHRRGSLRPRSPRQRPGALPGDARDPRLRRRGEGDRRARRGRGRGDPHPADRQRPAAPQGAEPGPDLRVPRVRAAGLRDPCPPRQALAEGRAHRVVEPGLAVHRRPPGPPPR